MIRYSRLLTVRMTLPLLAVMCLTAPGCRKEAVRSEVLSLEGKVEKIVVNPDGTGRITVLYRSEKHDEEMLGTGEVTKETEILINGAVAKLSDIREGEQIRGEVVVHKRGSSRELVALKIHVERAKPIDGAGG